MIIICYKFLYYFPIQSTIFTKFPSNYLQVFAIFWKNLLVAKYQYNFTTAIEQYLYPSDSNTCRSLKFWKMTTKKTSSQSYWFFHLAWQRPSLTGGNPQLHSALRSLTSVFEMGTGVSFLPSLPHNIYMSFCSLKTESVSRLPFHHTILYPLDKSSTD